MYVEVIVLSQRWQNMICVCRHRSLDGARLTASFLCQAGLAANLIRDDDSLTVRRVSPWFEEY